MLQRRQYEEQEIQFRELKVHGGGLEMGSGGEYRWESKVIII